MAGAPGLTGFNDPQRGELVCHPSGKSLIQIFNYMAKLNFSYLIESDKSAWSIEACSTSVLAYDENLFKKL